MLSLLRKLVKSKKGSPTLEYVIIIAAGAAFAGLLLSMFGPEEDNSSITKAFREKITKTVENLNEEPKNSEENGDGGWF